jgi:ferredoxin
MIKVMKSYQKLFGTKHQIIVIPVGDNFFVELAKRFEKIPGLKIDEELTTAFNTNQGTIVVQKKDMYVVLKNSKGEKFKEKIRDIDEEVTSDAFSACPVNAGVRGKTGDEINIEAREHLDAMRKHGFGAKL